jgi:hypothetical protein
MSTQEIPLQPDFREHVKTNDVPVAPLIGFELKDVADGPFARIETVVNAVSPHWIEPKSGFTKERSTRPKLRRLRFSKS